MSAQVTARCAARLPAVMVEVSTPHADDAPAFLQTMQGGVRIVKGDPRVKWSDGHVE